MAGRIYLLQQDGSIQAMQEQPYESEDLLQALLEKYPEILAGEGPAHKGLQRWLLVSREFDVPDEQDGPSRWSLDHLFVDQDGIPTLVEVKRSSDTRIRREVVGQMLDSAANAVICWPTEAIRARFETECERRGLDSDTVIIDLVGDKAGGDSPVEAFWGQVKTNLQAGRVRLVFVADEIPRELQRIVEFLNGQMDPAEVLAVEVRQFVGQGLTTLAPRLIGQTALAERTKGTAGRRQWDEASFFQDAAEQLGSASLAPIRTLYDFSRKAADEISWGTGSTRASFSPKFKRLSVKSLYTVRSTGSISLNFQWLNEPASATAARDKLAGAVQRIAEIHLPPGWESKFVTLPLEKWSPSVEKIIQAIESAL